MGKNLFRKSVLLGSGTAILSTMQVMAQEEAAATSNEAMVIEEVIVSARRRKETIQETPIAMTALSSGMIEAKGALNLGDLQGAAPNLLITNQNSGAASANLSIRGLTFADVEKSFEPTVAVVVDGVFIGTSTGQFFDFFDIEQIEVLRGPQGTLFGRNTIGGVINITRSKPTFEFGGKAEVSYGKFNTLATRAVVNVPLVDDTLAAKAFYFHNESDGYYRHGITGERVGASNNDNFGIVFAYRNNENFDANLTLEKQVQEFDPVNSNITNTSELFCLFIPADQCNRNTTTDLYTVFNDPAVSEYSSPAGTLEMNLEVGGITLTSVTGYRESDEFQTQDFDASTSDLYYTSRVQEFRQFSQELRGAGSITDSLDYVVGGYFYDHKYDFVQDTRLFGGPAPQQVTTGKSKSLAFFGDFNWVITDEVRLSFGGRWTQDKKSNYNSVGDVQFPLAEKTFNKFTPKVGVDYRPTDNLMVYASWSRGYRSGGFSGRGQTLFSSTTPYEPEIVDSYEIGLKSDFFDRRLIVNLAAFYSDYKDLQQNTTIPLEGGTANETIVSNVGSATVKGFEADVTWVPVENLTIRASLGLLDSEFDGFITQAPDGLGVLQTYDYSANELIYNPDITASVTADYVIPTDFGEIQANVSYRYIDEYDQQISLGPTTVAGDGTIIVNGNDPRVRSDKQGLLDASLTARIDMGESTAKVTVYGRNLTDDRGPNAAFTVAGLWSFASAREPRTFGVTVGFEF
ncbi:TonB-dependent receptor [Emcibacter sp.]|uniref:TonB-dependent receptor n=1 Tax=Emcibacter sp. TaxID=1979954 RepID=UPI002AA94F34|nr:TonB-dependent receptor [Emcibacter sp.]